MSLFRRFQTNASGATTIEYGIIATLIAVAIIAALTVFLDPPKEEPAAVARANQPAHVETRRQDIKLEDAP